MTSSSRKPTSAAARKTSSTKSTKVSPPKADPVTSVDTASAPEAAVPDPTLTAALSPVVTGNELRKKELFDLVVARSGHKKKDVKPIVEAMLAVLGDAFAEHREMQLPPLGKFKVQRGKELTDGRALVLKLRQKSASLNAAPDTAASATAAE